MGKNLIKSSLILIISAIFTKALGFLREIIFAYYLGTSAVSDAYTLGITLSQIVLVGGADAFFKVYLPIATEARRESEKNYYNYTINLMIFGGTLFLVLSSFVFLTANMTINILGTNASEEVINMAVVLCKMTAIPSVFIFIIYICQGYLHVQEKFWTNMIYPLIMNICIISILVFSNGNIVSMGYAYNLSNLLPAIILIIICIIYGLRLQVKELFIRSNQAIIKTVQMAMPLFLGGIISQINEIIDRSFSVRYETGILTALRYGKLLEIFIVSIVAIPIAQAIFPKISKLAQEKKYQEEGNLISKILAVLIGISIPIMFGIVAIGDEVVQVVFMRGAFNSESAKNTAIAFICYSFSILPVSFSEILNRTFISLQDTKKPIVFSMISMGGNIILNFIGVILFQFDFYVLAITTTIAEVFMSLLYIFYINKTPVKIKISSSFISSVMISSTFMFVIICWLKSKLQFPVEFKVFIEIIIGIMIFTILMLISNYHLIIPILRKKSDK